MDPPYRWTAQYENKFNFEEFDRYVLKLKDLWYTIFISEYNLPYWKIIYNKWKKTFHCKNKKTWKEKIFKI